MKKNYMPSSDILKKIKTIELHSRKVMNSLLIGRTKSVRIGNGLVFDQIREYQQGDDVRFIDWNASVRHDNLLVKQFLQESKRTIIIAVDISGSSFYGSTETDKFTMMSELASIIAFVASFAKDDVGLLLFSDTVEAYIPPAQGRSHVRILMERLFSVEPKRRKTSYAACFEKLMQLKKRNAMVLLFTDGIASDMKELLPVVARMYELIFVRCRDPHEVTVPSVGLLDVEDIETREHMMIDLRSWMRKHVQHTLDTYAVKRATYIKRCGAELLDVHSAHRDAWVHDVIMFLKKRKWY